MPPPRVRPQLPRLVDQIRILTWFQFHLSVLTLIVAVIAGAILSGQGRAFRLGGGDDPIGRQLDNVQLLMIVLAGTAILLGAAAAMMRRGWAATFPLALLAQVAVLVDVWLVARAGLLVGLLLGVLTGLLLFLGGWVVTRLFHREVRAFLLRSSGP